MSILLFFKMFIQSHFNPPYEHFFNPQNSQNIQFYCMAPLTQAYYHYNPQQTLTSYPDIVPVNNTHSPQYLPQNNFQSIYYVPSPVTNSLPAQHLQHHPEATNFRINQQRHTLPHPVSSDQYKHYHDNKSSTKNHASATSVDTRLQHSPTYQTSQMNLINLLTVENYNQWALQHKLLSFIYGDYKEVLKNYNFLFCHRYVKRVNESFVKNDFYYYWFLPDNRLPINTKKLEIKIRRTEMKEIIFQYLLKSQNLYFCKPEFLLMKMAQIIDDNFEDINQMIAFVVVVAWNIKPFTLKSFCESPSTLVQTFIFQRTTTLPMQLEKSLQLSISIWKINYQNFPDNLYEIEKLIGSHFLHKIYRPHSDTKDAVKFINRYINHVHKSYEHFRAVVYN